MSKRSNDQVKQYARHSLLITGVLSVVATLAVAVPTYRDNQDLLVVIFAIAALLDMILVTLMSQLRPIKKHHQANFIVAGGQVLGMGVTALAQYLGANEYIIASCFLGYTAAIVGVLFGVWCKALNALPVGAVKREGDCVVDVQDDQEGSGHPLPDAGETSPNNDTPRSPRPLISSCGARRCCLIPPRLSSTSAAASTQPRHEICWARLTCKVSTYFSSANEQDSEGRSLNNVVEERHTVDLSIALLSNV